MIYIFKCKEHGTFEVKQEIGEPHVAHCPECWEPAERVYTPLPHTWKKQDFNRDGSRDLNPDLPHVPEGTKYTHGWTPKEKK